MNELCTIHVSVSVTRKCHLVFQSTHGSSHSLAVSQCSGCSGVTRPSSNSRQSGWVSCEVSPQLPQRASHSSWLHKAWCQIVKEASWWEGDGREHRCFVWWLKGAEDPGPTKVKDREDTEKGVDVLLNICLSFMLLLLVANILIIKHSLGWILLLARFFWVLSQFIWSLDLGHTCNTPKPVHGLSCIYITIHVSTAERILKGVYHYFKWGDKSFLNII